MIVRGVDYGHVLNSSGARGFFGEGYWFHRLVPGLRYSGSTFVSKTTTLGPRAGNMPLRPDFRPAELVPKCVVVRPFKGVTLNAVGLSGPGLEVLLHGWRALPPKGPWMLSIMAMGDTQMARGYEVARMAELIRASSLPPNVGIQLNISCPNVGLDPTFLVEDARFQVESIAHLGRPLLLKVNALFPVGAAVDLSRLRAVDGFVVSNTIPWGKMAPSIDWRGLFGSDVSPLAHLGGGGLSGKPLLPIVTQWVRSARAAGLTKAIVGGGGILSSRDALEMVRSGSNAVELGSLSILRPWRVASVIRAVNRELGSSPRMLQ